MRIRALSLAAQFIAAACSSGSASPGPSTLSSFARDGTLHVGRNPPGLGGEPTGLTIELESDCGYCGDCSPIQARATVNGIEVPVLWPGGRATSTSLERGPSTTCGGPSYLVDLAAHPTIRTTRALDIRVADAESAVRARVVNLFVVPEIAWPPHSTTGLDLQPGMIVTAAVTPPPEQGFEDATLRMVTSLVGPSVFELRSDRGEVEVASTGISFTVPDVTPLSGFLVPEGSALQAGIMTCEGPAACRIGDGFTEWEERGVDARIVLP